DPHGDPIPAADGSVDQPQAQLLSALPAGTRVRVERISDADPRLLTFCAAQGIVVGAELEIREGPGCSAALEVSVVGWGTAVPRGRSATAGFWPSETAAGA